MCAGFHCLENNMVMFKLEISAAEVVKSKNKKYSMLIKPFGFKFNCVHYNKSITSCATDEDFR